MATVDEWRKAILEAIDAEPQSMPGRAGETPVSNLAQRLSDKAISNEDYIAACAALGELVGNPHVRADSQGANEYWRTVSYLVRYLPDIQQRQLAPAFLAKLFDREMRARGLSVYALHGYLSAAGTLTPEQIEELIEIKRDAPIAWISAGVMSSLWGWTKQQTLRLLTESRIDLNRFLAGLDVWRGRWDRDQDFPSVVREFRNAVPAYPDKKKFDRWLDNRGLIETQPDGFDIPDVIVSFGRFAKASYKPPVYAAAE